MTHFKWLVAKPNRETAEDYALGARDREHA